MSPYLEHALIDNGVALVTSGHGGRLNVMTVSFFAESSHLPVLLRVAIAPTCWTHELIIESGWFGLSVLSRGQERLAVECGTISGRDEDKFRRLELAYRLTEHGVPLLADCLTTSECRVVDRFDLGDHTVFVAEITASFRQTVRWDREPLLLSELVKSWDGGTVGSDSAK